MGIRRYWYTQCLLHLLDISTSMHENMSIVPYLILFLIMFLRITTISNILVCNFVISQSLPNKIYLQQLLIIVLLFYKSNKADYIILIFIVIILWISVWISLQIFFLPSKLIWCLLWKNSSINIVLLIKYW